MASDSDAFSSEALAASIVVLTYSGICLGSSILLFFMLYHHGERWSYISLIAIVVSFSTLASIVQQCYLIPNWHDIQVTAYEQAKLSLEYPSIALGPLSTGFNLALWYIQMYCYNTDALLILCWAIALIKGVYHMQFKSVFQWESKIVAAAKISSVFLPAIFVGVPLAPPIQKTPMASLMISCAPMMLCFVIGSICIIMIVFKYVQSRHLFASLQGSRPSGAASLGTAQASSIGMKTMPQSGKITVDKWLLLRFTVCFLILSAFEITVIIFEWTRYTGSKVLAAQPGPAFSRGAALSSVLQFIPGVTSSLLAFVIFGTTGPFRKIYRQNLSSCFESRRKVPSVRAGADSSLERGWRTLDGANGLEGPTYHCSVRGGNATESIELSPPSSRGKAVPMSKFATFVREADDPNDDTSTPNTPFTPNWPLRASAKWEKRLSQSWRSLGVDKP